jgi:hypothetical protein
VAAPLPARADATIWNTFLGGSGDDFGGAIHVAADGSMIVVGSCDGSWGAPILPFSNNYDAVVAKLDAEGNLLWNTFLGGDFDDYGYGLAVDAAGVITIAGLTEGVWSVAGTVVSPYVDVDGFVARLDASGNLLWRTYTGGTGAETCTGVALLANGNVAVCGSSDESWGSPLHGHAGGADDAFAMVLGPSGARLWSTFLGGAGADTAAGIAVDTAGAIYVAGTSDAAWGSAIRAYSALTDGFVARLTSTGAQSWNTFLGGSGVDQDASIVLDGGGDLLVAGASGATWGSPVRAFTASIGDGFAAKLSPANGLLLWHTFLGGAGDDSAAAITDDGLGNIFAIGTSSAEWGTPSQGFAGGGTDAVVMRLDADGALAASTFVGGSSADQAGAIGLDAAASVLAVGRSNDGWGLPIRPYTPNPGNNYDAWVAMVDIAPPIALAFQLDTPATSPTNADDLVLRVTFAEAVLGVDAADFLAIGTTASIAGVVEVVASEYRVTISGGDLAGLNGVVGLDFAVGATIADLAGNDFLGLEPLVDEFYLLDNIAPIASIDPPTPADPSGSAAATFFFSSDDPTAVFEADLDGGGFLPAVSPTDLAGLADGPHAFTVRAIDEAGNSGTAGFAWWVDLTPPEVIAIQRADPDPTSEPVVDFTVAFSEPVTGVQLSNFSLATTGVTGAAITGVSGAVSAYTVTVSTGSGVGTIRLDLTAIGAIVDGVGHALAGTYTAGENYTIVPPEPQFRRGDANTDFGVNIADAVFILDHLFTQGPSPSCRDTADVNDDGMLNIADPISLLGYLFSQGLPPPAPFGTCGIDPTSDPLDCASYDFCQP